MQDNLVKCAKDAALKAGNILREGFGTNFEIDSKEGRNNLVTEYDHRAEKAIIDHILKEFPDHIILAEESGYTGKDSGGKIRWVIDPLDGTVNFAHNLPIFSVSAAAEYKGEILAGAVYNPILKEMFTAVKGNGAFRNDKPIKVSDNNDLKSAFVVTGFPYNINENPYYSIDIFSKMVGRGIPVRRLGSAALDLCYVAAGIFDVFWEVYLHPWDVAAGYLIVEEAGGTVTDYDANKFEIDSDTILATNGILHQEFLKILNNINS